VSGDSIAGDTPEAEQPRQPVRPGTSLRALLRLGAYAHGQGSRLVLAFLAMAVLGLATGAYAWLVGPALRFLLTGGAEGMAWLPGLRSVDRGRALYVLPLMLVLLALVKGCSYLAQFYWMGQFGQRTTATLRRSLFDALLAQSPAQLGNRLRGDLLSRFSADVRAVETAAIYTVGSYVRDGIQVLVLVGVAVAADWRLAVVALACVPMAVLPVSALTRAVLRRTREGQARLGTLAGQAQELLSGIRTVQAYGAEDAEIRRFSSRALLHARALSRAAWARSAVPALTEVLAAGAVAAALAWAGTASGVPPERLVSLLAALLLLYQPAKDLGRTTQFATQAAAASERLFEVLDTVHPVADAPLARPAPPLVHGITLCGVEVRYGDRPALRGMELTLPIGQVTALVGPSGGGKSTVVSLLLRFVRPTEGVLLWDAQDVDCFSAASLRAQTALVTQDPLLFSGSIKENLLLARPSASDVEVQRALALAHAEGFVRVLPQGWDTALMEMGAGLSGGQRQRLALARAVLREAPLWVLDEATSNLDPESEREIQLALKEVLRGRTALVVAHRLETVVDAHCIHVVDGGRVVERGTHVELLAQGGAYARLWALQHQAQDGSGRRSLG
jgi:ATP-binding cassette, subfamily B, bacterial MsbA